MQAHKPGKGLKMAIDRTPRRYAADTLLDMPSDTVLDMQDDTLVDMPGDTLLDMPSDTLLSMPNDTFANAQSSTAPHPKSTAAYNAPGETTHNASGSTPYSSTATTLDMPAETLDQSGDSPCLSGTDIPFMGDDGKTYLLHTSDILGSGAQGTVVRATDETGARYAAKISWMPRSAKDRMNRNAVLAFLCSLMTDHPLHERHFTQTHLMPVYAIGQVRDEMPGMGETTYDVAIMPVCDPSLGHRTDVSFEEIRALILPQAAAGLHLLHENRIVHRDIKPKNLYMLDGNLVLGDYGISSVLDAGRDTGSTKIDRRTPGYSPHSSVVQRENDWYSLGYTIWTLYNGGRHPHQALINADDLSSVLAGGRPVPFAAHEPAHETLGELIFGLTYAFAAGRLGYDDVMRWCEDPTSFHYADPVLDGTAQPHARRGYQFEGAEYLDRASLTDALCAQWERAKRHLYTHALEEYFRGVGETDLAVALNDIVEMDKTTISDHDLGLARALSLIDPQGPAFRWKGRSFELNGFADFSHAVGDSEALAFLSSGIMSRWAQDHDANDAADVLRAVESDTKSQPEFALQFCRMKFSDKDPDFYGAKTVDECFARISSSPAGFYAIVDSSRFMHELTGFLAAAGLFSQAEMLDCTLDEGGVMACAGRLLALFDEACGDKDAVRAFNAHFGPLGHVGWMARNTALYEARSETARNLLARAAAAPDCTHMPVAQAIETLTAAENAVLDIRAHMAESPYMARLGLAGENEDILARNADAYFTSDFQDRLLPRGYIREMVDASWANPEAAMQLQRNYVGSAKVGQRTNAAKAAHEAAGRLREEAAKQSVARTSDGRKLPWAVATIVLTVVFVLMLATIWPHITMTLHVGNIEHNVGGFLSQPIAQTSTLSVLAFVGFLVAVCVSMSYRIADIATLGRNRSMANETMELAARVAEEGQRINAGIDETTQMLKRLDTDMPPTLGVDAHLRSCASYTQGEARVRRGPCAVLFWAGATLCAVCLFALTVSWLPSAAAVGLDVQNFDPSLLQGIYLAAAIVAFAIAAWWTSSSKSIPGTCAMCLAPTAGVVAAYAIVTIITIALFGLAIALILGIISAIFR